MNDGIDEGDVFGWQHEPYFEPEDTGYGRCPDCGSYLYNSGPVSEGDGDIGDELMCPLCQEPQGWFNRHWYDEDGNEVGEP